MRRTLLAVLLLVSAACGGGDDDGDDARATGDRSTTTVDDAATATTVGSEEEVEAGTTATSAGAGADAPAAAPTTTAAAAAPSGATPSNGPAPLQPGTYRFRQSGSASGGGQRYDSPPEGTLVVDPAGSDGRQVLHRYIDPEGEPADTTIRFGADGMFIEKLVLRQGTSEITCTFDPGIPAPPWPAAVGKTFTATGECGLFQLQIEGSITGTRRVDLDGRAHEAFVVESTFHAQNPQLTIDGTQLDWFVPELRMSTHTESTSKGKFGEVTFESSGSADLLSAIPS